MRDKVGSIIRPYLHERTSDKVRLRREAAEHDDKHVGGDAHRSSARPLNGHHHHHPRWQPPGGSMMNGGSSSRKSSKWTAALLPPKRAFIASLSIEDVAGIARHHPLPSLLCISLLFFMGVEYTHGMVPSLAPPVDLGFVLTQPLHSLLATRPSLNSALAALNTVFVGMQIAYILWTLLVEGRPRPTIATLFMFASRGILGSATQLPLPQGFLGSGADFPVGNVSFFLFFSGHVAAAVIASLDMRRTRRHGMAWAFDALNMLQGLRLLASRGHYTIDLAVGVGAGFLFDILAGNYEDSRRHAAAGEYQKPERVCCACDCSSGSCSS
ncbi:phosphatidylcholine:diacylglycerol cholinephosphotransferase 1-like [Phoenix dactylifera]|uniref:Phosphatidylcholine:diacylglycerol cholinephosphotransferase 1-like n=1 Tax=Phoenix dactylifera TaxID=42345 RepID=A0A8B8J9A9_PHODC|nr:phosphatidylcholine:diacylglycerol cholinephosphotransferase 1-like [Phoenix dactylifera]XP_026663873.2 phosphatidylcholine:diacylglycerol cholinephosphotransferase 1-like [Phoenix dactylifera]XP_026663874.2 phosphatidylcholine:diacylglycerol cholinephosphotransferase 1-like [Phoenix dactylifera]